MEKSKLTLAIIFCATSFPSLAATVVSSTIAEEYVVVNAESQLSLTITPVSGLTIGDIKKGDATTLANYKVVGDSAAIAIVNQDPQFPYCAWLYGETDNKNRIHACLAQASNPFVSNGSVYYANGEGDFSIRGGNHNKGELAMVGADSYKLTLEAVSYRK